VLCRALPLVLAIITVFGSAADALAQAKPSRAAQPGAGSLESTLVALDRKLWEAVRTKDTLAFSRETVPLLLDVGQSGAAQMSPADMAAAIRSCDTRSYQIDSAAVIRATADAAVLTYRVQMEQTCGGERQPTLNYVTGVWALQNGRWKLATLVVTPGQLRSR
jgi:uncharacterized protein DUF4440